MYFFKNQHKNKALKGRTIMSIAEKLGMTSPYLIDILNSRRSCSKYTAYCISKCLDEELEDIDTKIKKYFKREE